MIHLTCFGQQNLSEKYKRHNKLFNFIKKNSQFRMNYDREKKKMRIDDEKNRKT